MYRTKNIYTSIAFKDNFFDIIFIAMIVEHVVDINKFLSDILKILKPGGKVICICHNELSLYGGLLDCQTFLWHSCWDSNPEPSV